MFKSTNMFSFLHLPVQAKSNHALDDMIRKYHRKDFENVSNYLLNNISTVHMADDIICGFPIEREIDFDKTMDLSNKHKFTTLNVAFSLPKCHILARKDLFIDMFVLYNVIILFQRK